MLIERLRLKPEVEFQYGGCFYQKPEVVMEPEVDWNSTAAILTNRYDVITPTRLSDLNKIWSAECKIAKNGNRQ